MKSSWDKKLRSFMLPGLKRWILVILCGIGVIVYGVFLLMGYHPINSMIRFTQEVMEDASEVLPYRISGLIVIIGGAIFVCWAILKMTQSVLGAYLPEDRESIPDVLYRRRHLARGPRVVVIGGGTGLATLLKGLKIFTNNITAIVTVGDDGGSSGRLRQELGVLPPGDIRNCITALADEEKLVTELFQYRFDSGTGLEGHSFGNLFLTALCSVTQGDMLEAVRVASRVLNSCGQVLPATLGNISLVAEMADGRHIRGESQIPEANGRIVRLRCDPENPEATPEALHAIRSAELIVLGPGSLYTSIIPNLLIRGIPEAVRESKARKIYICNVMTQYGETTNYSVADHVEALLTHSGGSSKIQVPWGGRFVNAVLVNDELPSEPVGDGHGAALPVRYDPEVGIRLRELGVVPIRRSLLGSSLAGHHDPYKLAREIIRWHYRKRKRKAPEQKKTSERKVVPDETGRTDNGSGPAGGQRLDARALSKASTQATDSEQQQ